MVSDKVADQVSSGTTMNGKSAAMNGNYNGVNGTQNGDMKDVDFVKQHANWANCVPVDTQVYGKRPEHIPEGKSLQLFSESSNAP